MANFAGLYLLKWTKVLEIARSLFNVSIVLGLAALPIILFIIIVKVRDEWRTVSVQNRFGSLVREIRHYSPWQAQFTTIFVVRRLVYALSLVFLKEYPAVVTILLILSNMLYIAYLNTFYPQSTPILQNIDLANEILLMLLTYHLMFTEFSSYWKSDPETVEV